MWELLLSSAWLQLNHASCYIRQQVKEYGRASRHSSAIRYPDMWGPTIYYT